MSFKPEDYFDLNQTEHLPLFEGVSQVWDVLPQIEVYLKFRLKPAVQGQLLGKPFVSDQVFIGEGTVVEPGACILGPAWIGRGCQIRHGAYIRGNVIVGDGCVLGNSCEFKNCLLLNQVEVPHFSYVGDSILGFKSHLAAGVILSNLRLDQKSVLVHGNGVRVDTGLRKFGAIVGDHAQVGCHAVINPGTMIGRHSHIYPGSVVRGVLPEKSVIKNTLQS
jgi:UDP-N-acetylglucosamine diphosphorylase / glucose-1-phosphate thymidylyltransferase / UDP-N-acetylgalactosamine diphosphorylase / glucosamine-1-phosphate N-acetyltransferase / galactosamine-1-phosphate N-acetyltransferase